MIRQILTYVFLCFSFIAVAQQEPVLMRINGKEVLRSEFEYLYNKNNKLAGVGQKTPKEYADLLVNSRLKVEAAEAAGIDTTRSFQARLDAFRNRLTESYLTDGETAEKITRRNYDKMKADKRLDQVLVSHIYKSLPQNILGGKLRQVEATMDSIYAVLMKGGGGVNFDTFIKKFSDEKEAFWVSRLEMPSEFEDEVFRLQTGEISRPFFTPQGIHIVKVLKKRETPSFEEVKDEMIRRQIRRHSMDQGTEALVEKLKKEYHYSPDKVAMDELISNGHTSRVLFTLANKAYTGKEFARFATAHPAGVRRQFNDFVMKSVLDYEKDHLDQKQPEFRLQVQEFRDGLLLNEIYNREVKSKLNENGLKAYFDEHRSDYHWKESRYKGIVLHCINKRVAKQARKFLKHLPEKEWLDAIRLTFNAGAIPQIQAEIGLFSPGDNTFVDDLVFKTKSSTPLMSFPFTVVMGKKVKGPDDYKEVGEQLLFDYQNYLEQRWVASLRASSKVEINQEVLKTVNNH